MYVSPAYTITAAAAVAAAFAFLPYPWAHQASGAISAGLMAWAGYHAVDHIRENIQDSRRAHNARYLDALKAQSDVSEAHTDLKAPGDD